MCAPVCEVCSTVMGYGINDPAHCAEDVGNIAHVHKTLFHNTYTKQITGEYMLTLLYKECEDIVTDYYKWIKDCGYKDKPMNVLSYLQINGYCITMDEDVPIIVLDADGYPTSLPTTQ